MRHAIRLRLALVSVLTLLGGAPAISVFPAAHATPVPRLAAPQNAQLTAVRCQSPTSCIAVGYATLGPDHYRALAERWKGHSWQRLTASQGGAYSVRLTSLACLGPRWCMAVGQQLRSSGSSFSAIAERWNGSAWTVVPTARLRSGYGVVLSGVVCQTTAWCMAVGGLSNGNSLVAHWGGQSWRIVLNSNQSGGPASLLNAISCWSKTGCLAAGTSEPANDFNVPLASTWTGGSWSATVPPGTGGNAALNAVSCPAARYCVAVGQGGGTTGTNPLADLWNAGHWTERAVAHTGWLNGASCPVRHSCLAVGGALLPHSTGSAGIAAAWNGTSWRLLNPPSPGLPVTNPPPGAPSGTLLEGVACARVTPSWCMATGWYTNAKGVQLPLSEIWNGTSWSVRPVPTA